jgi:hypothetical protein
MGCGRQISRIEPFIQSDAFLQQRKRLLRIAGLRVASR